MNRIQLFGIERANNPLLPAMRGLYATARPTWRLPCQVSGRFHSETEPLSLPSSSSLHRQRNNSEAPSLWLSRSNGNPRSLRRAMGCVSRTSRAAEWPICVPKRSGRTTGWRASCNARVWTSAACRWHAWNGALPKSAIQFLQGFKRSLAFPSPSFFHRKFRIRTRTAPNVSPRHCPVLILQRNPGANAKS